MKETFVVLWSCYQCGRLGDQYDYQRGVGCFSCKSHHMRPAAPSFINLTRYYATHPKMLLRAVLEAFLVRDR